MFNSKSLLSNDRQGDMELFPLDIVIDRNLSIHEIIEACATIFSLPPEDIVVVEDISESMDVPEDNIQLFCEQTFVGGDFKNFLSLHPQNYLIEEQIKKIGNELDIAQKLNEILHSKCLVKDSFSFEEYEEDAYFLIEEKADPKLVYIDIDKLDNDLYVLQ